MAQARLRRRFRTLTNPRPKSCQWLNGTQDFPRCRSAKRHLQLEPESHPGGSWPYVVSHPRFPCPLPGRRRSGNGSVSDRPGQFGRNLGLVTDDDGNVFELEDIRVFHPDCTFACWMALHTASGGDGEVSSPWIWRRRG
jgi:hypothetical protein